ncbi:MTH2-like protein [Mya arenaria]|uniref:MTH2-like protein n=2 Tax=Mya arenaria TaxID=6604 RepID=A0ABY7EG98_MYAAR|nr:MTH2-like protein [Mya arenaria]
MFVNMFFGISTMNIDGVMMVASLMLLPSSLMVHGQTAPTTPWHYYPIFGDYDSFSFLKYGPGICTDSWTCGNGLTYPVKNCHCDKLCVYMNDCCDDFVTDQSFGGNYPIVNADQFSCERVEGLDMNTDFYGVLMVSKCSSNWTETQTKRLCESDFQLEEDLMKKTPVSDGSYLQITYKNMYCAYCNFEYDISFWSPQYECYENITNVRLLPFSPDCELFFTAPMFNPSPRICGLVPPISKCANNSEVEFIGLCEHGRYYTVFDEYGKTYRNEHCAQCNGVNMSELYCTNPESANRGILTAMGGGHGDSLRLLVDLNLNTAYKDGEIINSRKCNNDEIYDLVYDKCREVFCPPPTFFRNGRCIPHTLNAHFHMKDQKQQYSDLHNCTWAKLDPAEYTFTNDSKLFIPSAQETYNESQFHQNGTDVFICHSENNTCVQCDLVHVRFNFDESEVYLSTIGLVISILSLLLTVIIYSTFPQLLNTPGKILMCLVVSLLLAQLLFLISSEVSSYPLACKILAICDHYFFLAAFCWMNVIAFDLWKTFSSRFTASSSSESARKKLFFYSIYGWVVPLIIVGVALILEFGDFDSLETSVRPYYGRNICWISSRNSLIIFFLAPLAFFKLFDITSFIFTSVHIARASKQGAVARRNKYTCSLLINIKLSLVMGLTWVFAFVANVANLQFMWYLFIIFNTLQGLFIAISFLCTRKVGRLVHEKYEVLFSTFTFRQSIADTQTTSVSKTTSQAI